jgi:hypothetical protein
MKAIEEALGDDILLRKPFQLADLSTSVRRALARGEAMAQQAGS